MYVHKGSLWNIASVFGMGLWNYKNKIMSNYDQLLASYLIFDLSMLMTWQYYGAMVKVCISVLTYYAWWLWIKNISWHSMYVHVHKGLLWNIASVHGMRLWNYRNKIMSYYVPVSCFSCSDFYVRRNQTPPPRKEIRSCCEMLCWFNE